MDVLWNMDGKSRKLLDFLVTLMTTNRLVKWWRGEPRSPKFRSP